MANTRSDDENECNTELFKPDVTPNYEVQYMKEQKTLYTIDVNVNSSDYVDGQTQLIDTQPTFSTMDI